MSPGGRRTRAGAGTAGGLLAAATAVVLVSAPAEARPARCSSTDDGAYACDFRATGRDGSFVISARGKPTYYVNADGSGGAFVHADFGTGRNVALPGPYLRSTADRACWVYDGKSQICVW
jgi:hypothetical protein